MNALSRLEGLLEADRSPLGPRSEGPLPEEACCDEHTQPQDEGASEGFVDGAGI
jgi:hypothetical protein